MGVESKKSAPPLPAPTETDTLSGDGTELATELSRVTDKTSYSLPEDGTPVTLSTRRKKAEKERESLTRNGHQSQTSLLIEYFEGGKGSQAETRRPSVRVKVTPSSKSRSRSSNEHIQITETKGNRKPSYTKRINLSSPKSRGDRVTIEGDDSKSLSSYASATEESNLSRNGPIEIEVMRRHGSPLIPTGDDHSVNIQQLGSDVSSMPANSFLDGNTRSPERKRSQTFTTGEKLAAGAATGLAAAAIADALKTPSRRRSRSLSRERVVAQKVVEKVRGDKSERRHRHRESRSRSVSNSEKTGEVRSPRRRSSRSHVEDSLISGADSSQVTSSRISDNKSFKSGTSKSSINNPKLLETVEDAIRRLILPELTALKKEQKAHANRDKFERERRGSITSGSGISRESREELSTRKVSGRSSAPDVSTKSRERDLLPGESGKLRKDRRTDHVFESGSPRSSRTGSGETIVRETENVHRKRSGEKKSGLAGLAAGVGLGALTAAALHGHNSKEELDERSERRRRRKEHSRTDSATDSYEENGRHVRMPMMSDINSSEITRTSILSADTERPQSASEEYRSTPIHEVNRGLASPAIHTPVRSPKLHNPLHLQHGNHSRDNFGEDVHEEYEVDDHGRKVPIETSQGSSEQVHRVEYDDDDHHRGSNVKTALAAGAAGAAAGAVLSSMKHHHDEQQPEEYEEGEYDDDDGYYRNEQTVPSPLRYVPYNQQKRGLSPIPQSVSSYRDDDQQHRDSRTTRSTNSYSTLNRSPQHKQSAMSVDSDRSHPRNHDFAEVRQGGLTDSELTQDGQYWEEQHQENDRNRDIDADSYRSSDPRFHDKHMSNYTDDSVSDRVAAGQTVRGVGAIPDYVHTPLGVESAVASLVSASVLTGGSGNSGLDRKASYASYDDGSERHFTSRGNSPSKHDNLSRDVDMEYDGSEVDSNSQHHNTSEYPEYELDEQGRKVTMPNYKKSHLAGAAIGGAAAGAAAAAIANHYHNQSASPQYEERLEHTGAPLQKSFKDRAMEFQGGPPSPRHSIDRSIGEEVEHEQVKMGASGIPDLHDPMPEIGAWQEEGSDITSNHSVVHEPLGGKQGGSRDFWPSQATPTRATFDSKSMQDSPGLKAAELALLSAAGGAGAAAAIAEHNRDTGHDHDDQWQRTSEDRKRDTLITNPYEGTSPVALLGPQQEQALLNNLGYDGRGFTTGSPAALQKDEGYISSVPNNTASPTVANLERRAKGVGFMDDAGVGGSENGDPFYTPNHGRHNSGLSHGMGSPFYDSATGNGIDRIQSKDIVALMDHLTVRDAQRSARDTEILVTLVRSAAEMRNSFEDMRKLLLDTEDVIIHEVERNTDKSVQKVINGPRPPPASTTRSARGSQDDMIDDIPTKRRNVFRRALKGLSMRSSNDLAKIEEMLVQLLGEVEGLKVAQGLPRGTPHDHDEYDDMDQEGAYEQDRGYEPEGHAGTSTASHASQSGHFSTLSRATSATRGYDSRKFSENRISTVPEGDEEELEPHEQALLDNQFENNDQLLTPIRENIRGGSAPLGTPPQHFVAPASLSNENTPKTDRSKKHKSSSSSGWNPIPKISRWSETTASTVAQKFRNSGRRDTQQYDQPPSRSGSDLGNYDQPQHDPYGEDKLHSGYSQEQFDHHDSPYDDLDGHEEHSRQLTSLLPPEDPKYKAHRNSLNLQHPQPRQGPTHRYQTALESQAQEFGSPMSPKSLDWGSTTSVNRLPANANQNRYSNNTNQTGHQSPMSEAGYSQHEHSGGLGPARPPKEPLDSTPGPEKPPKVRPNKLTKPSPLSNENLAGDVDEKTYSNMSGGNGAPVGGNGMAFAQRSLSASLGVPKRKPTGPRSMVPSSPLRSPGLSGEEENVRRNKNRDTFGTIASNHSGESETF